MCIRSSYGRTKAKLSLHTPGITTCNNTLSILYTSGCFAACVALIAWPWTSAPSSAPSPSGRSKVECGDLHSIVANAVRWSAASDAVGDRDFDWSDECGPNGLGAPNALCGTLDE